MITNVFPPFCLVRTSEAPVGAPVSAPPQSELAAPAPAAPKPEPTTSAIKEKEAERAPSAKGSEGSGASGEKKKRFGGFKKLLHGKKA